MVNNKRKGNSPKTEKNNVSPSTSGGRGLGKGLGALLQTVHLPEHTIQVEASSQKSELADAAEKIIQVDLNQIAPRKDQARKTFDPEKMHELAQSIAQDGVIQPIILQELGKNGYEIVAGERRWRAAREAGLKTIPAIIRDYSENHKDWRETLLENIQREDLNAMEAAMAFQKVMQAQKMTQEGLADMLGKSRSAVANTLRLLHLPEEVQKAILSGEISEGHGRALLALSNESDVQRVFSLIRERKMSVREAESYIRLLEGKQKKKQTNREPQRDLAIKEVEGKLSRAIGTRVHLKDNQGKGFIQIPYKNLDDLDRILEKLI